MPDPEYFVPFYKTCPICKGTCETETSYYQSVYIGKCDNCGCTGTVKMLIPLDEFADLTDMNEEALHNIKCHLEKSK